MHEYHILDYSKVKHIYKAHFKKSILNTYKINKCKFELVFLF